MNWQDEELYSHVRQSLKSTEALYQARSPFQNLEVFRNPAMGTVLMLDGVVQTCEADEFVYHEMMVHPAMLAHGAARRVLVIGGGDGGCAREVLRHDVERVVMVELDEAVVRVSREYLPSLSAGAFDDPRLELVIGDGATFVARSEENFDVIVVDSTDPIGPGLVLFQKPFYVDCRARLGGQGILITQNGVPFFQRREFEDTGATRAALFRNSGYFFVSVPTYYGGQMALGLASDGPGLTASEAAILDARYRAWGAPTRYYNPEVHRAALAMPNYLRPGGPEAGAFA